MEMGVTITISWRLEVNLFLFEKQGGKSHFGTILLSAVSEIWRFCMVSRLLLPISMETKQDPKEDALLIVRPAIPVRVLAPKPKSTFKYPGPLTRYN